MAAKIKSPEEERQAILAASPEAIRRHGVFQRIEQLRTLATEPIDWHCSKKHTHVTRSCPYKVRQPSWSDVQFLLDELDYRKELLAGEEIDVY